MGMDIIVFDGVYIPSDDSLLLAEYILRENRKFNMALDVGCGCGFLTLLLANKANYVLAVDLNPMAVANTKVNAHLHGLLDRVDVLCADLLYAIRSGKFFDLIVFNPPYVPENELDMLIPFWERISWCGGHDGRQVIDRFLSVISEYVRAGSMVLMVQSDISNFYVTVNKLKALGFKVEIINRKKFFFEELCVVRAVKRRLGC